MFIFVGKQQQVNETQVETTKQQWTNKVADVHEVAEVQKLLPAHEPFQHVGSICVCINNGKTTQVSK